MGAGVREFLRTPAGKNVAVAAAVIGLGVCVWSIIGNLRDTPAMALSRDRYFVCTETGKSFKYSLEGGETFPIHSPYSGKNTGMPAELCFWTKDGKAKDEPTPVLLKSMTAPTFCPDCGRLVSAYNPRPGPGVNPPPLQSEYKGRPQRD